MPGVAAFMPGTAGGCRMPHHGKSPGHDHGPGRSQREVDHDPADRDLDRSISDPESWGEPLSYVDLLTDRTVQARIARLIVQSALKRPHRRW